MFKKGTKKVEVSIKKHHHPKHWSISFSSANLIVSSSNCHCSMFISTFRLWYLAIIVRLQLEVSGCLALHSSTSITLPVRWCAAAVYASPSAHLELSSHWPKYFGVLWMMETLALMRPRLFHSFGKFHLMLKTLLILIWNGSLCLFVKKSNFCWNTEPIQYFPLRPCDITYLGYLFRFVLHYCLKM